MADVTSSGAASQFGTTGGNLLGIANLINSLAPIFLGSGTTTKQEQGTTATAGTTASQGTTSTVTGAAPSIINSMLAQLNQALANATDPSKVQPVIDNIIQQAKIAFAPTLASLPTAGIYNSTSLGLLAGNAAAQASANAAATVLNFQSNQQQLASNIGNSLLQATKTQDTTSSQQQQSSQAQQTANTTTAKTSSIIPGAASALLGGVGALGLTDKLGLTNIFGLQTPNGVIKRLTDSLGLTTPTAASGGASAFGIDPEAAIQQALEGATTGGVSPPVAGFSSGGLQVSIAPGAVDNPLLGGIGAPPNLGTEGLGTTAFAPTTTVTAAPTVASTAAPTAIGTAANDLPAEGTINAFGTTAEPVTPATSGGFFDSAGNFISGAQQGFQSFAKDVFGNDIGGFLSTPAPGLGTIASDIGNVFDTGFSSDAVGTAASDIGSGLASAGAGVAGGLLGGLVHKGNAIGSQVGSTIGGVAGSLFGPIGSFAGSFLGDIIGSLFGQQHPENRYFYVPTSVSNGRLQYGSNVTAQNFGGQEYQTMLGLQQQLNSFNQLLDKTGLKLTGSDKPFFLGTANPHGNDPVSTFNSIGDAFSNFRFASDNPAVNNIVQGQSFKTPNDLIAALQSGSASAGSSAQQPSANSTAAPSPAAAAISNNSTPSSGTAATGTNLALVDPFEVMASLGINAQPFSPQTQEHEGGGTG